MIKKTLLLIPLLALVSCTSTIGVTPESVTKDTNKVYKNVFYDFDYEKHSYKVRVEYDSEDFYYVPPKNYYTILVNIDFYYDNNELENEYFVSTNELFVYKVQ